MKFTSYLIITLAMTSLVGCLKTREDLRSDESDSRPQQQQTISQAKPVKHSPPAPAPAPVQSAPASAPQVKAAAIITDDEDQMRHLNGRIENLEQAQAESKKNQVEVTKQVVKEETDARFKAYEEELKALQLKVQALTDIQEQKVAVAEMKEKNPKAFYEKGEELFKEQKWKEAISAYQKYREAQPKGQYQADATYKIGVCFQELHMKDEAKTFYEEVIQKAPKSREAKKAAIRLKSLK